jgi:hypothetical protein
MILPATSARYWSSTITGQLGLTFFFALASCWVGLTLSYLFPETPSGPAIVLTAGGFFLISVLLGPLGFGGRWRKPFHQYSDQTSTTLAQTSIKLKTTIATGLLAAFAAFPAFAHDMKVVASFSILGDMGEQVVGEHAEVTTIVGPDADAHVYQPSVADARAVAEADVIFVNGMGFETWSDTLIAESGTDGTVYVATEDVTPVLVDGEIDPHAWNALTNGVVYVQNIADATSEAMPDHATEFQVNAAS